MEQYHLPSLEPFFVPLIFPKIDMAPYFVNKFKNIKIFGHTKITDLKAKMNFEDKTLTIAIINPEMRYEFDYETKCIMFFKLIDTSGTGLFTKQNVSYTLTFTFEEYTRDNQDYLLVIDSKLVWEPQSMKIHFDNLFKDKILNDGFSREMSADWKKSFVHFAPIYSDTYAQAYGNVFNRFLEIVPLTDLIDGV
ncbi:unnamed protein product [Tenebrio molitor]|nr:unnamed protein product [Tenebrio molitor]